MMTRKEVIKAQELIGTYYNSIEHVYSDGTNELMAIKEFLEELVNAAVTK